MNIQDYISSGIIETYAMGLAGEEEARDLEMLCIQYPEVKAALQEAEETMENYAQLNAIAPPEHAKAKIWAAIDNSETEDTVKVPAVKTAYRLYPYLSIAASLLLVVGIPYHFYKVNQYQSQISNLEKDKFEILAQNKTFQARVQQASEEVNLLTNPETKNIILASVAGHENNRANVYWSKSGEVFIKANQLAQLPNDKQYQLWAIVNGKPVSAGLLDPTAEGHMQKMIAMEKAEMFAITVEKQGGSAQPTLDQMVVAGKTFL